MKALFSSDWQASYENLELCSKAAEEILRIKERTGFEVFVLCGDLKHIYNPIDLRVVNFWQRTIKKWIKAGMEVVVNLGNHDRLGMHNEKPNWLPVLRNVGAKSYDEPTYHELRDGYRLRILPFRQNPLVSKREAYDVAASARADRDVLVFHADIKNARYNVLSRSVSNNGLDIRDLYPRKYMYCIGGHLHFQQLVAENVYYVGSPFATDWGEANQNKGYLLLDFKLKKLSRIRSEIPGWYDPSWPKFEETKPESWEGAHVRIKVHCEGNANIAEHLRRESEIARRNYPGARLSVIPEFASENRQGLGRIRASQPDDRKIRIYLQENLPDSLRSREAKIKEYLLEQLRQVGGIQREGGELKFISAHGKNFLSYKNIAAEFKEGLTVVSGRNLDWLDKSNGSGKTSFLQMIAVALFGQTFKGQKHDSWMRRGTGKDEKSFISVLFRDSLDRLCIVSRGRQGNYLKLHVEGQPIELGNRQETTQRLIESLTGYTWETLSNAVYVDQGSTHLMLNGTEAQRKGFLAKLQNLERFERAEKRIKEDRDQYEEGYNVLSSEISGIQESIKQVKKVVAEVSASMGDEDKLRVAYLKAKKKYKAKKTELASWENKARNKRKQIDDLVNELQTERSKNTYQQGKIVQRQDELNRRLDKLTKLSGQCPTCLQDVSVRYIQGHIEKWRASLWALDKQFQESGVSGEQLRQRIIKLEDHKDAWLRNEELAGEVSDLREEFIARRNELIACKRNMQMLANIGKQTKKMEAEKEEKELDRKKLNRKLEIIKYAQTVFQRNGLPAFLNAQVCPELNQAAQEYSELFAQSEIQVRFAIDEEGRMDVQVVNAHGGENVEDQSEGEMKLASLITAFAVRSLAPKTNILILDEPGDGLDSVSARNFAKGLREISKKFCIIYMTTHNPVILAELADSRHIEIVKKNKISRVQSEEGN